ncbi:hypothetical protein HNR07_001732 [Nocardiopsis metallicus]|uniref:Uncharacterized protein n=1 Tax=Nocardiopsis metallicus TaxID=179819 RepID=A0A840WF61_9ACTN|nr:hypothetical protein [Nocardiopsis metallicus]
MARSVLGSEGQLARGAFTEETKAFQLPEANRAASTHYPIALA